HSRRPANEHSVWIIASIARGVPSRRGLFSASPLARTETNLTGRRQNSLTRFSHADDHVMDHRWIASLDLGKLDVLVLSEVCRHGKMSVSNHAIRGHARFFSHCQYHVGFAQLPPFRRESGK